MVDGAFPVTDLRETLRAMPCGATLLDAAPPGGGVHLVGGAVRDLLRGGTPRELDVAVEGDTTALLTALGGLPLRPRALRDRHGAVGRLPRSTSR